MSESIDVFKTRVSDPVPHYFELLDPDLDPGIQIL